MAILLATPLTSCISDRIEYIEKPYVPEISFPIFPELDGEKVGADGFVSVPSEWIVRLAEYKIRIEETEKNYNDLKALYEYDHSRE